MQPNEVIPEVIGHQEVGRLAVRFDDAGLAGVAIAETEDLPIIVRRIVESLEPVHLNVLLAEL